MKTLFSLLLSLLIAAAVYANNETRLLRFPTIHGNQIVFTYAGDLYTVGTNGGVARKLTNHDGFEMFARFSPDGKNIAFTGQYDGNTEVYVMPSEGGIPKRLTYTATLDRDDVSDRMGPNNLVMGWKDNKTVLYRSRVNEPNSMKGQLFLVSLDGGLPQQLPLPRGGFASFSPDGKKLAYNQIFREFRTWKRYRGGQADEISVYDFDTKETIKITDNVAQDIIPMWAGSKIYFVSDRDDNRRMNIFSYDFNTKQTRQVTLFTEFDVKFPSVGDKSIVIENGGYLYTLDLATENVQKVTVSINEDFAVGRGGLIDVSKSVTNYEISPDGNRALFGARGDVFTVPAKHGATRNITGTPGVHERNSKWSPDGKWIAYVSDASGEDEISLVSQNGSGKQIQLTTGGDTYKYQILWSPDSKKIAWTDKKQRLNYVDVDSKKTTMVVEAVQWEISSFDWSPDSKWITYAKPEQFQMTTIYLYGLESKQTIPVTDGWFSSTNPSFSADGKFLFFVSSRTLNPVYSQIEWNHAYTDMSKIYLVTLDKSTKSPFAPKSDEVKAKEEKKEPPKKEPDPKAAKETPSTVTVKVDADGLKDRITVLPIDGAGYWNIQSVGDKLYYMRRGSKDDKSKLMLYELDKQKETELGNINGYEISTDGKKMLVGQDGSYAIIDLPSAKLDIKEKLNLSDLKVSLDRRAEWKQMYHEVWRQMRDFFYDPNLHKVDWAKMRSLYEPLLEHVQHRADLTYVMGELVGELNAGHAYVGGGDYPKPERIQLGLLGAKVVRDPASRYYQIAEILRGQNWDRNLRSPLTEIGVDVKASEYIIAIDGKPANEMTNLFAALIGKADKQVTLTVNAKPQTAGGRDVVVVPISNEQSLYYFHWVEKNLEKVSKATDGKIGYVHIPDMGVSGLNEFAKYYYPQLRKEGLIIDVRGNGGGNVSPMIIERLRRELAMIDIARNGAPNLNPGGMVLGPKVALIDEFSMSDGDIFAYRFKHYKLGPVIGKRSWGGVVGIRGPLPLLDGGFLNRPEFSRYDIEGKEWIMEGYGVDPDIVVENDPAKEYEGMDQQLDRAVTEILDALKKNPTKLAPPPPYPDKRK